MKPCGGIVEPVEGTWKRDFHMVGVVVAVMVVEPRRSAPSHPSSSNSFSHRTSARPLNAGWSQAGPVHHRTG